MRRAPPARFTQGFSYIALLIFLAVAALSAAAALQAGILLERRAAEAELLAIGAEFRAAFVSYANATPAGQGRTPPSLAELLRDSRYPGIRRHLRRLYADPLTGQAEWGTVAAIESSGIAGVYSLAPGRPIKLGNFSPAWAQFEGAASYADWVFGAPPPQPSPAAQ